MCFILAAFSVLSPTSGNLTSVQTAWERSYATKTTVRALVKQRKTVAIIFDQSKSQERPQYYILCASCTAHVSLSGFFSFFCVCVYFHISHHPHSRAYTTIAQTWQTVMGGNVENYFVNTYFHNIVYKQFQFMFFTRSFGSFTLKAYFELCF